MGKSLVVCLLAVAVTTSAQTISANSLEGVNEEHFGGRGDRHRDGRRRLVVDDALKIRHTDGTEALERSSQVGSTFDTTYMPLMQSPCRPEPDGYFGGTYGTPVEVQYAIKVEATPLAPIQGIVQAIEEKVADEVLANAFPTICGFKAHERRIQANGIKFDKIEELAKETCRPDADQLNYCGVYLARVSVYGKEGSEATIGLLSVVNQILNTDNPSGIHPELIAISPMVRGGLEDKYRVSNAGMAAIAVAIILLSAALLWYIIFSAKGKHMLRKSDETNSTYRPNSKGGTSTVTGGSSGSWSLRRPGGRNKRRVGMEILDKNISGVCGDEERTAFKPTRSTESVNIGTSAMLLLKDGRPAEIEFHPVENIERTMSQPLPSNSASRSAGLV